MPATPDQIQNIKKMLTSMGAYKGPINTNADDPAFVNAVAWYQNKNGLTATGRVDEPLLGKLSAFFNGMAGTGPSAADQQEALKRYGTAFSMYLSNPEIGPLLIRGAKEGWDETYLQAQIQNTNYWRQTQATSRAWESKKATDPSGAEADLNQSIALVQDKVGQLGINWLDAGDIRRIANDRIAYGWGDNNDAELNNVLATIVQGRPGGPQELVGTVGETMAALKASAASQLLALDDNTAYGMAARVVGGETTAAAYDIQFRQQAKAKVPSMAQMIDQGVTLADIFSQHKQKIAQQLEIAPEQVDLINDATWRPVLNYTDPKTGSIRPMTENEAEILARQQQGYKTTDLANERGADVTDFLSRQWGVRPSA